MKLIQSLSQLVFSISFILLTACASADTSVQVTPTPQASEMMSEPAAATSVLPTPSPVPDHAAQPTNTLPSFTVTDFPGVESISLESSGDTLYLSFGRESSLFVSRSDDNGQTFSEPVRASHNAHVHILSVERPALAVNERGGVGIAWLEMGASNTVWYARSQDGGQTFEPGKRIATEQGGETTMVRAALDAEGNPALAWIHGNDLRFARSFDQGDSFSIVQSIGNGSCECCQPQPIIQGDQIFIAYRSLVRDQEKGDIRDAAVVRSNDGGRTFGPVTQVSDAHWYLNACPISGPSLALDKERLYVTWMDGRDTPPESMFEGDVWFASSEDGGQTFSPNVRVNSELSVHNTLPVLAVGPTGRIHLAWEGQAMDAIYYTASDDGGQTFTPPVVIADSSNAAGRPRMPSLAVNEQGQVYLAWLDDLGAHLATWADLN
jgi:hypothetical protein